MAAVLNRQRLVSADGSGINIVPIETCVGADIPSFDYPKPVCQRCSMTTRLEEHFHYGE